MKKTFDETKFISVCEDGRKYIEQINEGIRDPGRHQRDLLMKILRENQGTEFGLEHKFSEIGSYEEYRQAVPLTYYEDYLPYINRMVHHNETNLITINPIVHYATTSGSTGKPKLIPVSKQNRELFSAYFGNAILNHLYQQIQAQGHKPGPVCFLPDFHWDHLENGVTAGSVSAQQSYNFRNELDYISTSPKALQFLDEPSVDAPYVKALFAMKCRDTSCLIATFGSAVYEFLHLIESEWESLVNDIRNGRLNPELKLSDELRSEMEEYLEPDPQRADELEAEFRKGFDTPFVPRIWPNMSMMSFIGGSFFSDYTRKIRSRYTADLPLHMNAYGASESMMAVPLECDDTEYSPLTDDVFFEFRLIDDDAEEDSFYLLDELEPGKDYEIIITNLSGFYRYRMMDVFRVSENGAQGPKGGIAYRLNQVVSMVGERCTTEQLDDIMKEMADYIGTDITNYALYPDYSTSPGRYIILAEPDEDIGKGDQLQLGAVADELFRKANRSFNKYREQSTMGMPLISYLEPGSFLLFKELQINRGISPNQVKPVKVIDNEMKESFFFGLSEGPYKAISRVLYSNKQKLLRMQAIKEENRKLKKKIEDLEKENAQLRKMIY